MNQRPTWIEAAIRIFCVLLLMVVLGCKKSEKESLLPAEITGVTPTTDTGMETGTTIKRSEKASNEITEPKNDVAKEKIPAEAEKKSENPKTEIDSESGGILGVKETVSVRSILDGMVTAYKNARTYRDSGEICVSWTQNGQEYKRQTVYRTSFQRPNRLLLEVNKTGVLADGEKLCAYTPKMPEMLLRKPCPEKLSFLDILSEREIYAAITDVESNQFCYLPPPLVLLLSENPLNTFLYQIEQANITLLPSEKWENHECYRISARRGDEETIFWIDAENSVLRRIRLPVQLVQKETAQGSECEEMVTTLDFHEAELNWSGTLEMRVPTNAVPVTSFINPQIQMLGKPFPHADFSMLDGRPWQIFKGKPFFIFFWSVYKTDGFNFQSVEDIYLQFKSNPDLIFVGVNTDPPSVSNEKIHAVAEKRGLTCPIVRDTSGDGTKYLRNADSFVCFLIDKNGIVQYCDALDRLHHSSVRCDQKIRQVLDNKDVFWQQIADLKCVEEEHVAAMRAQIENGIFLKEASLEKITIATKKIMPATEPIECKKTELWQVTDVISPSAILPLPERNKILVLENGNSIATLDSSGKILSRRGLKMSVDEYYVKIRASKPDTNGRRTFAVIGKSVALFDNDWTPIAVYPHENSHPQNAVSDAILDDLDRDGEVELYVSFRNESGVHKLNRNMFVVAEDSEPVTMRGEGVQNVFQMVGILNEGKSELRVVDESGNIAIYDPKTMEMTAIQKVAQRTFSGLVAFDFENDGTDALAALALGSQGKYKAVGLTLEGTEVWNIDLPNFIYQRNIEKIHPLFIVEHDKIVSGWLLIGADSSLSLIDPTGMLMDQFYFGSIITGSASAVIDGKPMLFIATPKNITALEIVR